MSNWIYCPHCLHDWGDPNEMCAEHEVSCWRPASAPPVSTPEEL